MCCACDGTVLFDDTRETVVPSQQLLDKKIAQWKGEDDLARRMCVCGVNCKPGNEDNGRVFCLLCKGFIGQPEKIAPRPEPPPSLQMQIDRLSKRIAKLEKQERGL
jgi:hypothetical protein